MITGISKADGAAPLMLHFDCGVSLPVRRCAELFAVSRQAISDRVHRGVRDPAILFGSVGKPYRDWKRVLDLEISGGVRVSGWGYAGRVSAAKTIQQRTPGASWSRWREGRNDRA